MARARFTKQIYQNLVPKIPCVTPLPGRNDPYDLDLQRPGRISASADRIRSGLPGIKGGTDAPAFLHALSQTKTCGGSQNNNPANSPHLTNSHNAAHQGSGRGVPDLHEVVVRPADNASAVRGESDGPHAARMPRQGVHLQPAHHYSRPLPRQNLRRPTAANKPLTPPHSSQPHNNAHLGSGLCVPDLREFID